MEYAKAIFYLLKGDYKAPWKQGLLWNTRVDVPMHLYLLGRLVSQNRVSLYRGYRRHLRFIQGLKFSNIRGSQ